MANMGAIKIGFPGQPLPKRNTIMDVDSSLKASNSDGSVGMTKIHSLAEAGELTHSVSDLLLGIRQMFWL